ncbi:hypothetical protein [Desulfogranum japonicum]|uniref:hypothetical protein n=1 Tax=Desulfogranum japonicum TaxID=231447 RepID=UPI00040F2237|nr:hypothetical protein [Desulfogranum japonicum]
MTKQTTNEHTICTFDLFDPPCDIEIPEKIIIKKMTTTGGFQKIAEINLMSGNQDREIFLDVFKISIAGHCDQS